MIAAVGTVGAIAGAVTAVVGLLLYWLKGRDTPAKRRERAYREYQEAMDERDEIQDELKEALYGRPFSQAVVDRISDELRAAERRVQDRKAAYYRVCAGA